MAIGTVSDGTREEYERDDVDGERLAAGVRRDKAWFTQGADIPLMAVVKENKGKVRPLLDFREINSFVDTFTADADVRGETLRKKRQMGEIPDVKKPI